MSLTGYNPKSSGSHPTLGLPVAAPVLEYVCLFTHDLKRKQKRWQDGRLKFHTFNKRIMVYDERGNFIGDMHWREDFDFGEGEEFNLERGAVIVQVSECVGSKDQDLTDLLDKRAREAEQRYARTSAATANSPHPTVRPPVVPQNHPQASFRQRHLVDVVNTPRGPRGRAVMPTISPYEERIVDQQLLNSSEGESQRPIKRRRDVSPPSKSGYAQNLFGAALNLSSWSASASLRQQPTQTHRNASPVPETARLGVPSRNANSSWLRPSAILNLTGDDLVQVDPSKPSAAASKRECAGNATETPPKLNALVPTPFKAPGMGNMRSKVIQGEDQMLAEPEETLVVRGQQPQNRASNPRNTAAKHSARKSQDTKLKSIRHHSAAQPSNGALYDSAFHHISTEKESPEQRGDIVKDADTSTLQPLTDESMLRLVRDTGPEEPKSKLRIKARKKRGLLMVAKNTTARTSERQPDLSSTRIEAPVAEKQLMTVDTLQIVDQAARSIPPVGILPCSVNSGVGGDTSQCEPTRVHDDEKIQSWSDSAIEATVQLEPTLVNVDDSQSSGEPVHSRVRLREDKTQSSSGPHREVEMMTTQSGPRLASLGRRSVRSKEIIGSLDPRKCRAAAESPPAAPASRKETIICPKTDSERSSSTKMAETRLEEKATLLKNPATRGRKAAKKSDAAGSVPQPVLSGMPDLAVGRNDIRGGSQPEVTLDSAAALGGENAREVFGFSSASGGPWSKEAYDLLGCIRPGVKARVKGIGDGN
ncbi:hypothetical protein CGRA01v4_14664 [Colletotrichum graminicola]|uniref:5'-3' DNA helicase ZGRF1-like N-terminal domain-containing protein n=1 Tax=Colletotrichum graminicola (strain M1.001 / M2 / FGSC 10212) TaxID=645133 RepID=E3QF06_COLGM|nr:uncharacterized protein GLRG_04588 [Colletotrichum graminicola M1.001]EFQ29444.1 hypothetical protein GLRG_04588 [Colletotrichum graminicola M1.001]WDK23372.1 hypothetical protein CGRA01v4_14664 [Colletotrichum graminicola]